MRFLPIVSRWRLPVTDRTAPWNVSCIAEADWHFDPHLARAYAIRPRASLACLAPHVTRVVARAARRRRRSPRVLELVPGRVHLRRLQVRGREPGGARGLGARRMDRAAASGPTVPRTVPSAHGRNVGAAGAAAARR